MSASLKLLSPLKLPCGVVLPNRFCKSAMSENMAAKGGKPSDAILQLYKRWSQSGAGLLISGNVMVDAAALGEKDNVVIEDETHIELLKNWANNAQADGAALWMQINHPGRQAPKSINKEVVAPSAVGLSQKALFTTPRPLTEDEIWQIINRFGDTAHVAKKAGFKGVQIHGAHGYLVSQFLSSLTNQREDQWGGSLQNRARFVLEVYRNMRMKVGHEYPIGIKINSADFQRGAFTEEESLEVIDMLSEEGIDLIEVSGGTYERTAMMGHMQKESTRQREAYFADFIVKARERTATPLLLTGGFRTVRVMEEALANDELDMVGLARPFALNPNLVNDFISGKLGKVEVPSIKVGVKAIDKMGFLDTLWYAMQLQRMGRGLEPKLSMSGWKPFGKVMKELVFG
ncbi:MAG: NADH:flavin oxidoreductase/NADH oxidase family protein [Bacteroidota bacterium]